MHRAWLFVSRTAVTHMFLFNEEMQVVEFKHSHSQLVKMCLLPWPKKSLSLSLECRKMPSKNSDKFARGVFQ